MGLGGNACLECQLDGTKHCLFVMRQNQDQYLHHLPVAAGAHEQMRSRTLHGQPLSVLNLPMACPPTVAKLFAIQTAL